MSLLSAMLSEAEVPNALALTGAFVDREKKEKGDF